MTNIFISGVLDCNRILWKTKILESIYIRNVKNIKRVC